MDPLTFEAITRNPQLIRALMTQAHRERAEAVHRLIVEPVKSLLARLSHRSPALQTRA
jgi:hypothetical protein